MLILGGKNRSASSDYIHNQDLLSWDREEKQRNSLPQGLWI
jgi:hypothetical protein